MGAKPEILQRVLWGEWTFNKKTKRVQRRSPLDTKSKPMFVEFVLQQIFAVYDASYKHLNTELLAKMQSQIAPWKEVDLGNLTAGAAAVRELMSRWQPFADCILRMAVQHLPSPLGAAANRLPVICPRWFASTENEAEGPIAEALRQGDAAGPTVAYLAKFLAADLERQVLTGDTLIGDEDVKFVGLCRVFSGTMRPEQHLFVMREEDSKEGRQRSLEIERVFLLKGRFMEAIAEAPAGSIVAVQVRQAGGETAKSHELGVERYLTLCDSTNGPVLETPYSSQAFAIVRVSIEPKNVTDLDALDRGLRLLHKADPSVSVEAMVTGENVLGCCGDEHLKRCITDLQKLYARGVPLSISTPLVAVREAIAPSVSADRVDPKSSQLWLPSWASHLLDASTEASSILSAPLSEYDEGSETGGGAPQHQDRFSMSTAGVMSAWTANRKVCLKVSPVALPEEVLHWMDNQAEELESVVHRQRASMAFAAGRASVTLDECLDEITNLFEQRMREAGAAESGILAGTTLCGMSVAKGGRAVLLDATNSHKLSECYHGGSSSNPTSEAVDETSAAAEGKVPNGLWPSVLAGFQLAAAAGPLCEEPMRGLAFVLHGCRQVLNEPSVGNAPAGSEEPNASQAAPVGEMVGGGVEAARALAAAAAAGPYGPMSGQVMVAMKDACRYSLFRRGYARICEAMLSLEVQCEQETLGKVYGVLGKRRAKVLDEGLREGTSLFYINSHLPLADSFSIHHDLREAASGHVAFHCAFSHWELSEEDPFQEASLTPDEVEELGDQPLPPNNARRLVDAIRKRKGLATDEKVVKDATKQRTVTRMK